jgi:hypothetical protein
MKKILLPSYFKFISPYLKFDQPYLTKLGGFKDGAYVCDFRAVKSTEILISGGVGSNVRFESDFYSINKNVKVILIDPTVSIVRMLIRAGYHFLKKNQSGFNSLSEVFNFLYIKNKAILIKKYLNLDFDIQHCLFFCGKNTQNVFLKLDIEGSEYDVLNSILSLKEKFTGICIEFHGLDRQSNVILLKNFISNLDFYILHVSINEIALNNSIPSILEISFAPKHESKGFDEFTKSMFLQTSNTIHKELVYFDFEL